jgi:hypothetical protein
MPLPHHPDLPPQRPAHRPLTTFSPPANHFPTTRHQSLRAEARKRQLELSELQQERERSEVALRAELERARSVAAQEAERGASLAAEVEAGRASLKQQEEHIRR